MNSILRHRTVWLILALSACLGSLSAAQPMVVPAPKGTEALPVYLSPTALAASSDHQRLYVACATDPRVLVLDLKSETLIKSIQLPQVASGLAISPKGDHIIVTCTGPQSSVCFIDPVSLKIVRSLPAGHTALAPLCSPDGKTLFICNQFENCIRIFDLISFKQTARIAVPRQPIAAALTPNGQCLLVANHLPSGRADSDHVSASITLIDIASRTVITNISLPAGSTMVRDIRLSPDGAYACVTHLLAHYQVTPTHTDRGWIQNNALSLISLSQTNRVNTVLLDNLDSGAANPWSLSWSADGSQLYVTHAGTHELSVIDWPKLLDKLAACPSNLVSSIPLDLTFLNGLRQRISLDQKGPRSLALSGTNVYVANYFSDTISVIDFAAGASAKTIALNPQPLTSQRQGESIFNDATYCFQGWLSCASCHSSDARVDGLNWDLLNDGLGNAKNAKSLYLAHKTPPNMAIGVRANTEAAVRAGFSHILFQNPAEQTLAAVYDYLSSLKPIPSPHLHKGKLSKAAARGKKLFHNPQVGCVSCHNTKLLTDLKPYDVGTRNRTDKPGDLFYTPTLLEIWRTAPYLHDGSAASLQDVLTTSNRGDKHGKTSHLTPQQIEDLSQYLLSL